MGPSSRTVSPVTSFHQAVKTRRWHHRRVVRQVLETQQHEPVVAFLLRDPAEAFRETRGSDIHTSVLEEVEREAAAAAVAVVPRRRKRELPGRRRGVGEDETHARAGRSHPLTQKALRDLRGGPSRYVSPGQGWSLLSESNRRPTHYKSQHDRPHGYRTVPPHPVSADQRLAVSIGVPPHPACVTPSAHASLTQSRCARGACSDGYRSRPHSR
jgi:hypothetical protein